MLEHSANATPTAELMELLAYLRGCYGDSVEVFRGQIERLRNGN